MPAGSRRLIHPFRDNIVSTFDFQTDIYFFYLANQSKNTRGTFPRTDIISGFEGDLFFGIFPETLDPLFT